MTTMENLQTRDSTGHDHHHGEPSSSPKEISRPGVLQQTSTSWDRLRPVTLLGVSR